MLVFSASMLALAALLRAGLVSSTYVKTDTFSPASFTDSFSFFTDNDPTNGFVKYVGSNEVQSLISQSDQSVTIGVDSETINPTGGRKAVRLTSTKSWDHGLLVADISHMPTGCGLWPALWMVGPSWPSAGEIDIVEGVNMQTNNAMTLHTGSGCAVENSTSSFAGMMTTKNCDVNAPDQEKNAGCQIMAPPNTTIPSFGSAFNAAKGGRYAMESTSKSIKIWFIPASSGLPPAGDSIDTSAFGQPMASFAGIACDIDSHFNNLSVVINTDFCGDWAGNVWESGGCAASTGVDTCQNFVANHPEAFKDAFWQFEGMWMYQDNGNVAAPPPPPAPSSAPSSPASTSLIPSSISSSIPQFTLATSAGLSSASESQTTSISLSSPSADSTGNVPSLGGPAFNPGAASSSVASSDPSTVYSTVFVTVTAHNSSVSPVVSSTDSAVPESSTPPASTSDVVSTMSRAESSTAISPAPASGSSWSWGSAHRNSTHARRSTENGTQAVIKRGPCFNGHSTGHGGSCHHTHQLFHRTQSAGGNRTSHHNATTHSGNATFHHNTTFGGNRTLDVGPSSAVARLRADGVLAVALCAASLLLA